MGLQIALQVCHPPSSHWLSLIDGEYSDDAIYGDGDEASVDQLYPNDRFGLLTQAGDLFSRTV